MAEAKGRDTVPGFGEVVRAARLAAGLSLADLAGRAGCGISGLSQLERGERSVSLRLAVALAGGLGRDLCDLLRDAAAVAAAGERMSKGETDGEKKGKGG